MCNVGMCVRCTCMVVMYVNICYVCMLRCVCMYACMSAMYVHVLCVVCA